MNTESQALTLASCLGQSLALIGRRPVLWLMYMLFLSVILVSGCISLALGIFLSVTSVLIGVSIAAYTDQAAGQEKGLFGFIDKHLALAMSLAVLIVFSWLVFRVVFNLYAGEPEKILLFFFEWNFTDANYADKTPRQLIAWLYSSAIITLIFLILMMNSFASWFSYPLMAFKKMDWVQAKQFGRQAALEHNSGLMRLLIFILMLVFLGTGILPMLTPLIYVWVSAMIYVSYKIVIGVD